MQFQALQTGICHGLAFWFDVAFNGSTQQIWLSTSPISPLTHWYQVRCLLQNPIYVRQGQTIAGKVLLGANNFLVVLPLIYARNLTHFRDEFEHEFILRENRKAILKVKICMKLKNINIIYLRIYTLSVKSLRPSLKKLVK